MILLLPRPKQIEYQDKCVKFKETNLVVDEPRIAIFAKNIFEKNGDFAVQYQADETLLNEQYTIKITQDGIRVGYATLEGAYRATATLKQILAQSKKGCLPCLEIFDEPDFSNRGYMLDISRGKVPKMSFLKKLVDILADLKYNQLQLYMDAFVFEYDSFPQYTEKNGCLTKRQIQELQRYCVKRFIKLVPNQNGFGHMGAWTAKAELASLAITGTDGKPSATLNPLKEETLSLVEKIYGDVLKTFSCDTINIGMDEPLELGLNETKDACEKLGVGTVYTEYLNKVCELISKKHKKTPMFWDDIVFRHPEQLENIPKNAIVMDWGYEEQSPFERNCRRLAELKRRFYVCPGSSTWLTFTGRSHNATLNISAAAEVGSYYGAEGFLLTEWGDGGHPQFPAVTYFSLVFGGAVAWNAGSHVCDDAFNQRRALIEDCHFYVDKCLFHTKNGVSLSKLVYRMGNYYLLEDGLCFNHAETVRYGYGYAEDTPCEEKKKAFLRVATYMENLKKELKSIRVNPYVKRELRANAEMVIVTARAIAVGVDEKLRKRIQLLQKEFSLLWKRNNYEKGVEIFTERLEKLQKDFAVEA